MKKGLLGAAPNTWYQSLVRSRSESPSSSSCVTSDGGRMLPGKSRHRRQGGDGHGVEAITTRRCGVHVRVIDKVHHRWQHGGGSPASCGTGDEHVRVVEKVRHRRQHGGESPARCGTGGEHAAASVSWRHTCGEGVGGASLSSRPREISGNRRDKMALAAVLVLQRRQRRP